MERRTFMKGLACGGVTTFIGGLTALTPDARGSQGTTATTTTKAELLIGDASVNFTGRTSAATLANSVLPAPTLRFREGDVVSIDVRNGLSERTSIHWHGLLLPAHMDGVPGLSFRGIAPGETFRYQFQLRQSGTYWYHSHSGFQEQTGLYGALIIDPLEAEPYTYDREHVILLSDWTDRDPLDLYRLLKKQSDYFNYSKPTLGDFRMDAAANGFSEAMRERLAWGRMRMNRSDRADVSGHAYTYLMNGTTPNGNWTGLFKQGEKLRLRFINGSAMSYFDVRIPGLEMTVVAADGQDVHPVTIDEFRLGTAETIDVIVQPSGNDAFTVFAQSMDRTGFASGTLALAEGLSAPIPEVDRIVYLSMADMGHGHTGGTVTNSEAMDHSNMSMGMDHSNMSETNSQLMHPSTETRNPGIDMQTMAPSARLDDPGIGLRDNGRRVLTYADLASLHPLPDQRDPSRTIELHLTGHMERFIWSFDGVRFSGADPIALKYGERVRIALVNDTMMEHPIHLHGLWSDLEDSTGAAQLRKHTVSMPPGTRRTYRVTADALGRWAYHCHLLYHMEAGMFREVRVDV